MRELTSREVARIRMMMTDGCHPNEFVSYLNSLDFAAPESDVILQTPGYFVNRNPGDNSTKAKDSVPGTCDFRWGTECEYCILQGRR